MGQKDYVCKISQLLCYPIPHSKGVKLFLSLQLNAYQTDVKSRLELSKVCFEKQGFGEIQSVIQPEETSAGSREKLLRLPCWGLKSFNLQVL